MSGFAPDIAVSFQTSYPNSSKETIPTIQIPSRSKPGRSIGSPECLVQQRVIVKRDAIDALIIDAMSRKVAQLIDMDIAGLHCVLEPFLEVPLNLRPEEVKLFDIFVIEVIRHVPVQPS